MPGVQAGLIPGAVQREADGLLGVAAVEVIDEKGLYLLGHSCAGPLNVLTDRHRHASPISGQRH
jgi:hypothetical protein